MIAAQRFAAAAAPSLEEVTALFQAVFLVDVGHGLLLDGQRDLFRSENHTTRTRLRE